MRIIAFVVVCGLLGVLPLTAHSGQHVRYRWVDSNDHVHLSDNLPADAARFGYDLVNQYGRVIRHVEGDKTPEQILADKAAAAEAKLAAKQALDDERMMLAYPSEEDLLAGHEERMRMLKLRVESTQLSMKSQIAGLASLLDQAAGYAQRDKPVPAQLQKDIDHQRQVVRDQRTWIEKRQAEIVVAVDEFAQQLARYRTLRDRKQQSR